MEQEFNVRRLKTKDFFKVATILGKITRTSVNSGLEMTETGIGISFLNSALQHAESDVKLWLADLVSMKVSEFDDLPFDAPFQIIEKLAEQEDLSNFFTKVKNLTTNRNLLQ